MMTVEDTHFSVGEKEAEVNLESRGKGDIGEKDFGKRLFKTAV